MSETKAVVIQAATLHCDIGTVKTQKKNLQILMQKHNKKYRTRATN